MPPVPAPSHQQQPAQPKRRRRRRRPGEEEEPVLRTTCDACTAAKVKCNGEKPCVRCGSKNILCEYTFKKRCGPKRRKGISADNNGGLLGPCPYGANASGGILGLDDHLRGESTALSKEEVECVYVFMQNINSLLPMTTIETVNQAARSTALAGEGSEEEGGDVPRAERSHSHHAGKAMLHGVIALGAEFLDKEEVSMTHASFAWEEIRECFDAAAPELMAAHLIMALYWTHQMDATRINGNIRSAHHNNSLIRDPPASATLVASLTFISVVLYDAKVVNNIGCQVNPPGSAANRAGIPSVNNPAACQERVLNILSFVLLAIHNRFSSTMGADPFMSTGCWDAKAMTDYIYEAKALLEEGSAQGGPNDISRCIVDVLQAYFLLLKDKRWQAILITEPLADVVADNPLVLHFPIVWSLMGCVRVLLNAADRTIAVERLQSAMEPLASHLGFSTDASLVEQELMSVFTDKPVMVKRKGVTMAASAEAAAATTAATAAATTAATVAATTAATAAATTAATAAANGNVSMSHGIFVRQTRAQTSSLNVTAQDYSHRDRSPINMLSLEPSAAPPRRGLDASSAKLGVSRSSSGGGDEGGVSASLLSAAMISSGEPLLASPPPASRLGALTRAPATRSSLLIHAPFIPGKQPMLELDTPFMGNAFPDESVVPGSNTVQCSDGMSTMIEYAGDDSSGGRQGDVLTRVGKMEGVLAQLMRQRVQQATFGADTRLPSLDGGEDGAAEVEDEDGRQQSFKADAPVNLDTVDKIEDERRELMSKQHVQQSFVADAPVSLEQVETNIAKLAVSPRNQDLTSMDLEAAAELLATKANIIC